MEVGRAETFVSIVEEYQEVYDLALEIFSLFEDADASDLLEKRDGLLARAEGFLNISGLEWADCGHFARHMKFLGYYLKDNNKAACLSDIKDIVFFDLPAVLKKVIKAHSVGSHLDER